MIAADGADPDPGGALARAAVALAAAAEAVEAARRALPEGPLEALLEGPLKAPLEALSKVARTPVDGPALLARHTREQCSGRVAKIDADVELRAFVLDRIDTMTSAELADAIAAAFPPERRMSRSTLHRWWTRTLARRRRSEEP